MRPDQMLSKISKMKKQVDELQKELADKVVEGTAGGGAIKICMNGKKEVTSVSIVDVDLCSVKNKEVLEDMFIIAFNNAVGEVDKMTEEILGKVTQGVNPMQGLF